MKLIVMIFIFYSFFISCAFDPFFVHDNFITQSNNTEHINTHCYYLTKLTVPIHILHSIKCDKKIIQKIAHLIALEKRFHNPHIHNCLFEIQKEQSFSPLIRLWDTLNQYCFLKNNPLKRELCVFIFLMYKYLITYYKYSKKNTVNNLNTLYQNLDSKTLNELLEILNIISQELKPFIDTMEVTKETTLKSWAVQHWKSVLIITIVIMIKILIYKKDNVQKDPNLLKDSLLKDALAKVSFSKEKDAIANDTITIE